MTPEQVQTIHQSQLSVNQPFGILAVERGFLTNEQVDELLETQRSKTPLCGAPNTREPPQAR